MILVDTNVISETMKGRAADPSVLAWLAAQRQGDLYTSTINVMEILNGVAALPMGARRRLLEQQAQLAIQEYQGRILDFDMMAAVTHAQLMEHTRARGLAVGLADGQIGAIAAANGFAVCTRDATPFEAMNVFRANPWTDPPA
ncbi:MAG: type II toxin-antitoxin system VapC family toxin [Proteobacteria bacterium]|nr:type II toxin-antitoxin system VapC family toxin [Pseudomonadota bacterium]